MPRGLWHTNEQMKQRPHRAVSGSPRPNTGDQTQTSSRFGPSGLVLLKELLHLKGGSSWTPWNSAGRQEHEVSQIGNLGRARSHITKKNDEVDLMK